MIYINQQKFFNDNQNLTYADLIWQHIKLNGGNWPTDKYGYPASIMIPYSKNELDAKGYLDIIGPDTALWLYQLARNTKDWRRARAIVDRAKELGYKLSYCSNGLYVAFYL